VIVFADSKTESWEAMLGAVVEGGWTISASWPIDTELQNRTQAASSASLQSSVHLVCRPRERADGQLDTSSVGDWRDLMALLPKRMAEWMPRLADEGVVGADAIFACLGPALEIFSRYSRVEKASGEAVTLREYLEHVWAAVSNEALSMIFKDADASGLEPDARLTAMWLWTLGGGKSQSRGEGEDGEETESEDDVEAPNKKSGKTAGFVLEFDAARKIAQGLGIHLDKSESIVEVKGESARLLPVSERTRQLFGKDAQEDTAKTRKAKKKAKQGSLFEEFDAIEAETASTGGRLGGLEGAKPGATVLDKVHQSMLLFAAGRGEALKRFLVENGVGKDGRFWKLAQSLSALYPTGTDEKRWVDGVLARKKGLGF
jgi:putative DNA methylase